MPVDYISIGKSVIATERAALLELEQRIDHHFQKACTLLLACSGRIVVTGMGKSGHIGRKIAATFASTGSPAFFMHPAEAGHGDLGMITPLDVVIALSNSGESQELLQLLPGLKHLQTPLIALTGSAISSLAKAATLHLDVQVSKEACPLDLAPTSSTTALLAMGDALAISLLKARGFTHEDFARSHPSGRLGRRLLLRVEDIMHKGAAIPQVPIGTPLKDALLEMTSKGLGMTAITDTKGLLKGLLTDGDLRRALDHPLDLNTLLVETIMTSPCTTITADYLAFDALKILKQKRINGFLVVNTDHNLIGAFNMHDLLKHGLL